jgi:TonB family protein
MRALLVGALLAGACVIEAPASVAPEPVSPVDLSAARFCARPPGTRVEESLKLAALSAEVLVRAHAVRTHLSVVVENPGTSQVEAWLRLPVPPGAAVTRAVLHVEGRPMEGAFVERERARAIYRSITEQRRDPALVVWAGPEWVEVSIFPVLAGATRTFEMEWVEPAAAAHGTLWYRVPVLGHRGRLVGRPAAIGTPDGRVAVSGRAGIALGPAPGLLAAARTPGDPFGTVMVGAFAAAPASQPAAARTLLVVAETSAAMNEDARQRQRHVLGVLAAALPLDAHLTLLRADWSVELLAEQVRPAALEAALERLDAVPSAGGLDLEATLLVATDQATALGADAIIFVGRGRDGFEGDALEAPLKRLRTSRLKLMAVGIDGVPGPLADAAWLTGGRVLEVDETTHATTLAALLNVPGTPPPGLGDVTEAALVDAWQPLETVTGEVRWMGRVAGDLPAAAERAAPGDVEALWARARLAGGDSASVGVERPTRIVTPLRSLLVLEKDEDYDRWGLPVPRTPSSWWSARQSAALSPPLRPEARREARMGDPGAGRDALVGLRGATDAPDPRTARRLPEEGARQAGILGLFRAQPGGPAASIFGRDSVLGGDAENALGGLIGAQSAESYGLGGLGLVGRRATGGGSPPAGEPGRSAATRRGGASPQVAEGRVEVHGSLDKEIIRRVVRAHIKEVKFCYEWERTWQAKLVGRVVVQFTITSTGTVSSAAVRTSTLHSALVERCIAGAAQRWEFPRPPGGDRVVVSYPFVFAPGGGPEAPTAPEEIGQWGLALRMVGDVSQPVAYRVARAAEILGAPATEWPQVLAWWVVTARLRTTVCPTEAHLVAARLLLLGGKARDAVRLLSEVAARDLPRLVAELRKIGAPADAARLDALDARGRPRAGP